MSKIRDGLKRHVVAGVFEQTKIHPPRGKQAGKACGTSEAGRQVHGVGAEQEGCC